MAPSFEASAGRLISRGSPRRGPSYPAQTGERNTPTEALKYIYVIHLRCSIMPVKTTIILKDEIYQHLITKYGRRKISKTINDILMSRFSKSKKSIFGVDPW